MPHDVGAGAERSQRKASSDDLSQRANIRNDAIAFLSAPAGEAKPGDNLVEYKQHVVFVAKITQALQETGRGGNDPLQRLYDNRCDIIMFIQQRSDRFKVIERRDQHLVSHALGDTCAVRNGLREIHAAFRGQTHLCLRAHSMISALKLQDFVPASIGTGQSDRIHVRFAARSNETYLFTARHRLNNGFCKLNPFGVIGKKGHAIGELFKHRLHDFRMAVAKQHGSGTNEVVDIFFSVFIPNSAAFAACDDDVGIEVAKASRWQHRPRTRNPICLGPELLHQSISNMGTPSISRSGVTPRPGASGGAIRPFSRTGQSGATRGAA